MKQSWRARGGEQRLVAAAIPVELCYGVVYAQLGRDQPQLQQVSHPKSVAIVHESQGAGHW